MTEAITFHNAEKQMSAAAVGGLVKDIPIPSRPVVIQKMQDEMAKGEPDIRRIAQIIGQDIGITLAVLKMVNSPIYGLSRRAESIDQAVGLIGMKQLGILVTALAMRSFLKCDQALLDHFYVTSARRAQAMSYIAKSSGVGDVAMAQTFGLFCDVGIPMLLHRFPGYRDTLQQAQEDHERAFTAVEQQAHHTDHSLIGALMVKSWGLNPHVALAIRLHHDYAVFLEPKVPTEVVRLIAMNLIAEAAIQRYAQNHLDAEWSKGGENVGSALSMNPAEVEECIEQLLDLFANGLE
jgi:HD-like signal output (HDOD) protein